MQVNALLSQLFSNLIWNALKFIEEDVRPKITINASLNSQYCVIEVIDNGAGASEQYRSTIFQLFERLYAESQYEGSGIGLAICKKIVDLHHGTIWVEENPMGGSIFIVRLPIKQA